MCGIAGFVGFTDPYLLSEMATRLHHRGPDGVGTWSKGDIGLAATRLSLIDDAGGAQPLSTDSGNIQLAFNGEIYNHGELRRELMRAGLSFHGRSDSEVILQGFARHGSEFFDRLEGMYALAIADGTALYLARDPFGMKPLFYWLSDDGSRFVFASEIKAVLRCPAVPRFLDGAGLVAKTIFGHTLGCRTLLQGISHVPPGAILRVSRNSRGRLAVDRLEISRSPVPAPPCDLETATRQLAEMIRESVVRHCQGDHPVAGFLSGGVDSTILAAALPTPPSERIQTFVVSDDLALRDVVLSLQIARHLGTEHRTILIRPEEVVQRVPEAVLAAEEPRTPSIALLSAAKVRLGAKAAICGEGADELFAGYRLFLEPELRTGEYVRRLRLLLQQVDLAPADFEPTLVALEGLSPAEAGEERGRPLYNLLRSELLPNDHLLIWDRGTMASGLETRMPFLTPAISEWSRALPWHWLVDKGVTKVILRRVLGLLLPASLVEAVTASDKLSAPSALRISDRCLRRYASTVIPAKHREQHPFRVFFPRPLAMMLFDVFCFAFTANDGELPPGFSIERLYSEHLSSLRWELGRQASKVFRLPVPQL